MKFFLFVGVLVLLSFTAPNMRLDSKLETYQLTSVDCNYGQCNAIAKSTNKRCKHCVSNSGDSNCWQHD